MKPDRGNLAGFFQSLERKAMPRNAKQDKTTIAPLAKLPNAPKSLTPTGRAFWKKTGAFLVESQILTPIHLEQFELLCRWHQIHRDLMDWFEANPDQHFQTNQQGNLTESPRLRMMQTAFMNVQRLESKFGLTPKSTHHLGRDQGRQTIGKNSLEELAAIKNKKMGR